MPESILQLSGRLPVHRMKDKEIVDIENGGRAYCKGIYVQDIPAIFSYNINDATLNPDRNAFQLFNSVKMNINIDLAKCEDYAIIKKLLSSIISYYMRSGEEKTEEIPPLECELPSWLKNSISGEKIRDKYRRFLWKRAFEEIFEQEISENGLEGVVLKTDFEAPSFLQETLKKYKVIDIPKDWREVLELVGVKTEKEVVPEYIEEKIQTSLTLGYGAEIWDIQRMTLDSCQNHLPDDSKGNNIFLRFQTTDGVWHDYRELEKFQDDQIKKIKISDDGIGYDYKSLGLFASTKGDEKSSGKWGEGLKMLSASAVRNGIKVELRSRNWVATPYTETSVLNEGNTNEKEVQRLCFSVRRESDEKAKALDDGDNPENDPSGYAKKNEQSSTTFVDPTPELIKEFRNIRDSILIFSTERPMFSLPDIDVLKMDKGGLYVKQVLIPGEHHTKYTYHLKSFNIETRDRDAIRKESMQSQVRAVLTNIEAPLFIRVFLEDAKRYAEKPGEKSFVEFDTYFRIPSKTEKADLWIKTFQDYFGEDACVRKMSDQNYSEVAQAEHMGLETITLPDCIADTLLNLEGRDGKKLPSYEDALDEAIQNAIPVPENRLTPEERAIIQQLYKYNEVLCLTPNTHQPITQINIYEYDSNYSGKRAAGYAWYESPVHICRDTLEGGLKWTTDVFLHEVGHVQTGAEDSAPAFRNYQTALSAELITRVCPLEESIIDNGVTKGIRFPRLKNVLRRLFWKYIVKDKSDINIENGDEEAEHE